MDFRKIVVSVAFLVTVAAYFVVSFFAVNTVSARDVADSCIECHSHPDLRVIDKKLYKYYRDWELSIHSQEGVTCVDCHGGNPDKADKDMAHGDDLMSQLTTVEYERISATCGRCHKKNDENYKKSKHFMILTEKGRLRPTPTCVTCHGSINTSIPTSDAIAGICAHCHNAVTENRPEIPEIASYLVARLTFINKYYLHLISKGFLDNRPDFSKTVKNELSELARTWHTLDLDRIEDKTLKIRTLLMKEGREMRKESIQAD